MLLDHLGDDGMGNGIGRNPVAPPGPLGTEAPGSGSFDPTILLTSPAAFLAGQAARDQGRNSFAGGGGSPGGMAGPLSLPSYLNFTPDPKNTNWAAHGQVDSLPTNFKADPKNSNWAAHGQVDRLPSSFQADPKNTNWWAHGQV